MKLKKNDSVQMHTHHYHHLILYLTDGAPLILPELKITIQPKRGAYYIFPPNILHGVNKVEEETKKRYCLVTNIIENADWKKNKLIKEATDAREKK